MSNDKIPYLKIRQVTYANRSGNPIKSVYEVVLGDVHTQVILDVLDTFNDCVSALDAMVSEAKEGDDVFYEIISDISPECLGIIDTCITYNESNVVFIDKVINVNDLDDAIANLAKEREGDNAS